MSSLHMLPALARKAAHMRARNVLTDMQQAHSPMHDMYENVST